MDESKRNLKVELYLPNDQKYITEDTEGVMRDALSEFWSQFYDKCTVRHDVKITFFCTMTSLKLSGKQQETIMSLVGSIIDTFLPNISTSNLQLGVESFSESEIIPNALNGEFDQD